MADRPRQSTVACIEMSEAMIAGNALVVEIERAMKDGMLSTREMRAIMRRKLELDIEMLEAVIAAEKSDYVEGKHEWERKEPFAGIPRHLRDKANGIAGLEAELGVLVRKLQDNEPKPAPPAMRAYFKRKAKATPERVAERRAKSDQG